MRRRQAGQGGSLLSGWYHLDEDWGGVGVGGQPCPLGASQPGVCSPVVLNRGSLGSGLSRALRAVSGPSPHPVTMEMQCPSTLPGDPEGPETAAAGRVWPGTWSGGSSPGQGPPTTSVGSTRAWFSETALPSDGWMVPPQRRWLWPVREYSSNKACAALLLGPWGGLLLQILLSPEPTRPPTRLQEEPTASLSCARGCACWE